MSQFRPRPAAAALTDGLTPRQVEVVRLIAAHLLGQGRPPTLRWLADALGVSYPNGVLCHLNPLVKKGVLARHFRTAGALCFAGLRLRLECDGSPAGQRLRRLLGEDTLSDGGGI